MIGGKIIVGIGSVISTIGAISGAISAFIPVIAAVATAAAPFLVGGAIVAGIIAAGVLIYQNWDTIKEKAQALWDKITQVWDGIKQTVQGGVDKLKSLMNFEWKLPQIKLPHFSISGELSLNPPSIPSIGVEWYKKAYNNGVLFRQPTVLQTPAGPKGFGDGAGAEVVLGLNKLQELAGSGSSPTINVYAAPGQDVNAIADAVASKIYGNTMGRRAVYA